MLEICTKRAERITFLHFLDICKKGKEKKKEKEEGFRMEQRCVLTVTLEMIRKNTKTSLYTSSGVPLPSETSLFLLFCGLIWSYKMAVELFFGSSARVLKLNGCINKSVLASYLCLLILSRRTSRCTVDPP